MSSGNEPLASGGIGRYFERVLVPGRLGIAVFVGLFLVGLAIFEFSPAVMNGVFSAIGLDRSNMAHLTIYNLMEPALRCAVAFVAGYFFPRGFWLWGLALVLHTPLTLYLLNRQMREAGIEPYVGGTSGMVSFFIITAVFALFAVIAYTTFSMLGAFFRYFALKRRSRA